MSTPAPNIGSLAHEAGIDTTVCELCGGELTDSEPWVEGIDGARAHSACLETYR